MCLFYRIERREKMDFLENVINRRLISGFFPHEILYPVQISTIAPCNVKSLAQNCLKLFRKYPELLFALLTTFKNRVRELETLEKDEYYNQEVNIFINTGYFSDSLRIDDLDMACFCPAVTTVDKVLWYGAWVYYFSNDIMPRNERKKEYQDMMFAWIYLLKTVQAKEIKYGKTINLNTISSETDIVDLIEADWSQENKPYFLKLTAYGKQKLQEVTAINQKLTSQIEENNICQKMIADRTDTEWRLFIDVFNDLAQKEKNVISQINRAGSPKDKLRIIREYDSVLDNINRGKYLLNDREISLLPFFDTINERMKYSPAYCVVTVDKETEFRLHPAAIMLTMRPLTFNYLLLTYHRFRLVHDKNTAKDFASLALEALKKNLGEQYVPHISLNEIIEDFYYTVLSFLQSNAEGIERLSFDKLQNDFAVISQELIPHNDFYEVKLTDILQEAEQRDVYENKIKELIVGKERVRSKEEIESLMHSEEMKIEQSDQESFASRIIVSLNLVYLFCDALRIMLSNRSLNTKIKNTDDVKKYRHDLLQVDSRLINKVYANLGENEIGMLEYREKIGVIATSLSEQETEEEQYRNSLYADILMSSISSLVDNIKEHDTTQILLTKSRIREEILAFPECDEKNRYTDWLDCISQKMCGLLVDNCRLEENFVQMKDIILSRIKSETNLLPESAVDSLATAELLYAKYTSDEYAVAGFDFSCISALYYQAFENAYNELIWTQYADFLNTKLTLAGKSFTEILTGYHGQKKINKKMLGYGYLPESENNWTKYSKYNKSEKKVFVNSTCMYANFTRFIGGIVDGKTYPESELSGFYNWLSHRLGFSSSEAMLNDSVFMEEFNTFRKSLSSAVENRNNASHGGTPISIAQCRTDRRTVLSDLRDIRNTNLGLIQQLVSLFSITYGNRL